MSFLPDATDSLLCQDLITCTAADEGFISYFLGYAPYTNETRSWWVLLVMLAGLMAIEYLIIAARVYSTGATRHPRAPERLEKDPRGRIITKITSV